MTPFDVRVTLRANDYSPVAVHGKRPAFGNWQQMTDASPEHFRGWDYQFPKAQNTGSLTRRNPTFDIDVRHPEAADECAAAVNDWVGDSGPVLTRFGQAPKRAVMFQTENPFGKISRDFRHPNDQPDDPPHRLEFLCDGQQVVVHGIHEKTGKEYSWHGGSPLTVPRKELPSIDGEGARKLLDHCAEILIQQFGFVEVTGHAHAANGGDGGERAPVDVEAELAAMTPDNVNDTHIRVIPSLLWQAEHPDDIVTKVSAATMDMARRHGLAEWKEEIEVRDHVVPRVRSALKNLFLEKYDAATGEIPTWLCGEFHQDWANALAKGLVPNIGYNGKFFVRAYDRNGTTRNNGHDDTPPTIPETHSEASATALRRPRFPLLDFGELVPTDDEPYLVEDLIPRHGLVVIWGRMKSFKSTWTLDVFLHVARGHRYRGLKVQQGRVIYCVFEGSHGYRNRIEALRRHYEIPPDEVVSLHLMPASINLIKERTALIAEIKAQLAAKGITDMPIAIVLDTLNRSLTGSESKDEDMGAYIKAADELREQFNCLVAIVHHCGHDETRPRGHSSLPGAIDGQVKIERPERGTRMTAEVELMRDGPEGKIIHSIIKSVDVHRMPDGKMKTSPVLVSDDATERAARLPAKLQNTGGAIFARALTESLAQHGQIFQPDPGAMTVNAVNQEHVRTRFYELYNDGSAKSDAKKHAFSRALREAQKTGYVDSRTKGDIAVMGDITMIWVSYSQREEED
jgi:AAA domain/Bifunctional DNA primase/polymerase, N-terminal